MRYKGFIAQWTEPLPSKQIIKVRFLVSPLNKLDMGAGSFGGFNMAAASVAVRGARTIGKYGSSPEPRKPKKGFFKWLKSLFRR